MLNSEIVRDETVWQLYMMMIGFTQKHCNKTSDWGNLVPRINVENCIKLGFVLE
jgi:hypothetical protein